MLKSIAPLIHFFLAHKKFHYIIRLLNRGEYLLNTNEQEHLKDLERIKLLRYIDDEFMTVCLKDNYEAVELILRIVLNRKGIKIKSLRT